MIKPTPNKETIEKRNEESLTIDGCKVTIRFAERSNPTAAEEIRKILTSPVTNKQPDFLKN